MALEGTSAIIAIIAIIVGCILFYVFISIGANITEKKRTESQEEKRFLRKLSLNSKQLARLFWTKRLKCTKWGSLIPELYRIFFD